MLVFLVHEVNNNCQGKPLGGADLQTCALEAEQMRRRPDGAAIHG